MIDAVAPFYSLFVRHGTPATSPHGCEGLVSFNAKGVSGGGWVRASPEKVQSISSTLTRSKRLISCLSGAPPFPSCCLLSTVASKWAEPLYSIMYPSIRFTHWTSRFHPNTFQFSVCSEVISAGSAYTRDCSAVDGA